MLAALMREAAEAGAVRPAPAAPRQVYDVVLEVAA